MSIGLYDADMSKYIHVPFNLELMKIASYYKSKKEIVSLTPTLNLDRFGRTIYRQDYNDGQFDSKVLLDSRVTYGGRAFNPFNYVPLPEEIEMRKADVSIYNNFSKQFCTNKTKSGIFKAQYNAQHLRLSLDGKTIWKDFDKQLSLKGRTNTIMFYDYNLNQIDGAAETIMDIYKMLPFNNKKFMGMKFPIQLFNSNDLLRWTIFQPTDSFYYMEYNGIMDDEVLIQFIDEQKSSGIGRQLEYNITYGCKDVDDFINNRVRKVFHQIAYLRMRRIKIPLKYEPNFFPDERWEKIILLFNLYLNQILNATEEDYRRLIKFDSLYGFVSSFSNEQTDFFKINPLTKNEARELFAFVRTENYDLFRDFYDCNTVELEGGEFIPCRN